MNAKNYSEAIKWYEKAAALGNASAFKKLGDCYYYGLGVVKDENKAQKYYESAVALGCKEAQLNINLLSHHHTVKKDPLDGKLGYVLRFLEKIIYFILFVKENKKIIAVLLVLILIFILIFWAGCANKNNIKSTNDLSVVPKNESISSYSVSKKENNGSSNSFYVKKDNNSNAGKSAKPVSKNPYILALQGDDYCKSNNFSEAFNRYKLSAEMGNAYSMTQLGIMYSDGKGVEKDYKEALKWFEKAKEKKDGRACYHLGKYYEEIEDFRNAIENYQMAINFGYKGAYLSLGKLYEEGKGCEKDYFKAEFEYRKAIINQVSEAKKNLAYLSIKIGDYFSSKRDKEKALKYYKQALEYVNDMAERYDKEALFELGKMYEYGKGVKKDKAKAKDCYSKSAALGYSRAKSRLKNM